MSTILDKFSTHTSEQLKAKISEIEAKKLTLSQEQTTLSNNIQGIIQDELLGQAASPKELKSLQAQLSDYQGQLSAIDSIIIELNNILGEKIVSEAIEAREGLNNKYLSLQFQENELRAQYFTYFAKCLYLQKALRGGRPDSVDLEIGFNTGSQEEKHLIVDELKRLDLMENIPNVCQIRFDLGREKDRLTKIIGGK